MVASEEIGSLQRCAVGDETGPAELIVELRAWRRVAIGHVDAADDKVVWRPLCAQSRP